MLRVQMQRQQEEHQRQLIELQAKHHKEILDKDMIYRKETSFLKSAFSKAAVWLPHFREMLRMENFCLKVGFNERQTAMLISGKSIFYEGELYSEEHKRKFKTEKEDFQVVKDQKDKSKLILCIEGKPIRVVQGTI